jgi:hypothetical protein
MLGFLDIPRHTLEKVALCRSFSTTTLPFSSLLSLALYWFSRLS